MGMSILGRCIFTADWCGLTVPRESKRLRTCLFDSRWWPAGYMLNGQSQSAKVFSTVRAPGLRPYSTLIASLFVAAIVTAFDARAQEVVKPRTFDRNSAIIDAVLDRGFTLNYAAMQRTVTATFATRVKHQGPVAVGNTRWDCAGNSCSISTLFVPQTSLCKGIVGVQGQSVRSFRDANTTLKPAQLQECNRAARQVSVTGGFVASTATMVVNPNAASGQPGPSGNSENLLNQFNDRFADANDDFDTSVGWSPEIWQDGSDPDTFYYVPNEYKLRLLRTGDRPLALGFTHTYESEVQGDKTVLMTATFAPPTTEGDIALMEALANSAIQQPGGAPIRLQPYPIESVEVLLAEDLGDFGIEPEDIRVTGTPRNVLEPISIRVRMNEIAQSSLLSMMREIDGIGGMVKIVGGEGHEAFVPLYLSMKNVSGYPMPGMQSIQRSQLLSNISFMPVTLIGIVGYVKTPDAKLERRYRPMANRPTLAPGQEQQIPANVANSFAEAFGTTGVVHSWFDYEADRDCAECLATVERMAESQVGLTRRDEISIEIQDFVFNDLDVFKVTLQVRSNYFDSSGSLEEVRDYQLRPGGGVVSDEIFLDRSQGVDAGIGAYRMKVFYSSGNKPAWTDWLTLDSTDLTLVTGDFMEDR